MLRWSFRAMASPIALCAPTAAAAGWAEAARRVQAVFAEVEDAATRFRRSSPWMRLIGSLGVWQTVPRLLADLALAADAWRAATGGLFDPRILPQLVRAGYAGAPLPAALPAGPPDPWWEMQPHADPRLCRMRLWWPADLGGIGKGFACDRAALAIHPLLADFALDAGGDIALWGRGDDPTGRWTTGIEDPRPGGGLLACFAAQAPVAVATSAARRRAVPGEHRVGAHIIDPRTGAPVDAGIAGVTVVADTVVAAEVTAKTLLLAGLPALAGSEDWSRPVWWVDSAGALFGNRAARAALQTAGTASTPGEALAR